MKWICLLLLPLIVESAQSSGKKRIIVDTDAGADDALALTILLNSDKFNVEAITTVTGNTVASNVTTNVLKLLSVLGKKIPVYQGTESGLIQTVEMEYYFGYDGFGDFEFKGTIDQSLIKNDHPAVAIANLVQKNPGQITILCLGPLTNIALATKINSNLVSQAKEIIIVGGSYTGIGNVKPGIEFNMYGDPEAAALFFGQLKENKIVRMVPLEVLNLGTSQSCSNGWEMYFQSPTPIAQFLSKVWRYKKGDILEPGDGLATHLTLFDLTQLYYITKSPQVEYRGSQLVRGITVMAQGDLVNIVQVPENIDLCHRFIKCLTSDSYCNK